MGLFLRAATLNITRFREAQKINFLNFATAADLGLLVLQIFNALAVTF